MPDLAKILPLEGKYYGTKIDYKDRVIELWLTNTFNEESSHIPSDRELLGVGLTRQAWDNNLKVWDAWTSEHEPCREVYRDIFCDHYEDQFTYETALKIVEALNADNKNS